MNIYEAGYQIKLIGENGEIELQEKREYFEAEDTRWAISNAYKTARDLARITQAFPRNRKVTLVSLRKVEDIPFKSYSFSSLDFPPTRQR